MESVSDVTWGCLLRIAELDHREICGYIFRDSSFWCVSNIADDPARSFFMDTKESMDIQANRGPDIVGVFHSHPGGTPYLSDDDIKGWHPKLPWNYYLIASGRISQWVKIDDRSAECIWFWPEC